MQSPNSRWRTTVVLATAALVASAGLATTAAGPASATASVVKSVGPDVKKPWHDDDHDHCDDDGYRTKDHDECAPEPEPTPEPTPEPEPTPKPKPSPPPAPEAAPQPDVVTVNVAQAATIYEGTLPCGGTAAEAGVDGSPTVTLTRLDDAGAAGPGTCDPVAYELSNDAGELTFLKADGQPLAQFILNVQWPVANAGAAAKETYVDFGLLDGGYELRMPRCPAALFDATGHLAGLTGTVDPTPAELASIGITDQDGLPSDASSVDNGLTQYACVGYRSTAWKVSALPNPPQYFVQEQIYLLGDVLMRK
jgi:hypothetical protein